MIKYACDICESINDVTRVIFNVGKSMDAAGDEEYQIEDLDVCSSHIKMLNMYLLNRLTRRGEFDEQIAAYKYLHTLAINNHKSKEGLNA